MAMKIAISGKMGSGKTTLTNEILRQLEFQNKQGERLSLADPVKEVARNYFLMPAHEKDRALLQKIGQQFRAIRASVWIDLMMARAESEEVVYLCDDIRFQNELDAVSEDGWISIRLEVSESEQKRRLQEAYGDSWELHWQNRNEISETNLDGCEERFDMVLTDLALEDVPAVVENLLAQRCVA